MISKALAILLSIIPGAGLILLGKYKVGYSLMLALIIWYISAQTIGNFFDTYTGVLVWSGIFAALIAVSMLLTLISQRRHKPTIRQYGVVVFSIILFFSLFAQLRQHGKYTVSLVESDSNLPTLQRGDITFEKLKFDYQEITYGDFIGFYIESRTGERNILRKRVLGMAGDEIHQCGKNKVFINGIMKTVESNWMPIKLGPEDDCKKTVVPIAHYFVLGDNLEKSMDSRHFGPISSSELFSTNQFILRDGKPVKGNWRNEGK